MRQRRQKARPYCCEKAADEVKSAPLSDRALEHSLAHLAASGLAPRFVVFQASRDGPLHEEVAPRLAAPLEVVAPTLHNILAEVGRSRLVVTMRYHGGVSALLHNRPAVLLDYSPKMASLAGEARGWASLLGLDQLEERQIRVAVSDAPAAHDRAPDALAARRGRLAANDAALDKLAANRN